VKLAKKNWTDFIPGSETEKLAKKRVAKSKKLHVDDAKKEYRNASANGISKTKIKESEVIDTSKKKKNITKNELNQSVVNKVVSKKTTNKAGPKSKTKTTLKKAVKDTASKKNDIKPGKFT
jgi:hypothetical protein